MFKPHTFIIVSNSWKFALDPPLGSKSRIHDFTCQNRLSGIELKMPESTAHPKPLSLGCTLAGHMEMMKHLRPEVGFYLVQ